MYISMGHDNWLEFPNQDVHSTLVTKIVLNLCK